MCKRPAVSTMRTSQPETIAFATGFFYQSLDGCIIGFAEFAFVDVALDGLRDDL